MIRVRMYPNLQEIGDKPSGIASVIRALYRVLPEAGIRLVDDEAEADVVAVHAGHKVGIRGKPVVAICHGLYWSAEDASTEEEYALNAQVIESLREAVKIVVPSDWVAKPIERDMHRQPQVIPHAIFHEDWKPQAHPLGFALWNKNRVDDACDPAPLGALAHAFPDLNFVSTFHPEARLPKQHAFPNVSVVGVLPDATMRQLLPNAGIYLSTTTETFGIGLLEALACGAPVLAYKRGNAPNLVQHKVTGYLAEDDADLIAGMRWILTHRGPEMSAACIAAAHTHNWQQVAGDYADVFGEALEIYRRLQKGGVTIVIPCYNRADTLATAIDSALAQTAAARIIVVDNNSTDNTKQLTLSYATRGVEYTNAVAQGVAHARNHAIGMSSDPYICCLDADDEIAPTMLETTLDALRADPTLGVAYTGIEAVYPDGERTVTEWPPQYDFENFLYRRNQVPTCCTFRRDLWAQVGGYRQKYGPKGAGAEDANFFLRAGGFGWRAHKVTNAGLFVYHINQGITSLPDYKEIDWRYWLPWVKDGRHPFASLAQPRAYSHPVLSYDHPYVSIIIPTTQKHLSYLWDALESVEAQTVRNWECIVIADFAHSDADAEMQRLMAAHPFVRWLQGEARGPAAARNYGVKYAKATRILFLDADDFLHPKALRSMLDRLEETDMVAYSDYIGHIFVEQPVAHELQSRHQLVAYDANDLYAHVRFQAGEYDCERALRQPDATEETPYLWCLVTALIRKSWHEQIGGFDESMKSWEDVDYWWRMAWAGICFTRIAESLVEYRFHTGERRGQALLLSTDLLHWMQDKKEKIAIMPCGSCGKNRSAQSQAQFYLGGNPTMSIDSKDFKMVRLNDGNIGTHRIVGAMTKTDYGYRAQDDEFLMAPDDYAARSDVLILLDDGDSKTVSTLAPAPEKSGESRGGTTEVSGAGTSAENDMIPLEAVDGITALSLKALHQKGLVTLADAVALGREKLVAINGVGDKTADLIMSFG